MTTYSTLIADSQHCLSLNKALSKARKACGIEEINDINLISSITTVISILSSFNPFKLIALANSVGSLATHIKRILVEGGYREENLTKSKLNLLSILSVLAPPSEVDSIVSSVMYKGEFIDLESLIQLDDDVATDIIFDYIKLAFPGLSMVETALKSFVNKD